MWIFRWNKLGRFCNADFRVFMPPTGIRNFYVVAVLVLRVIVMVFPLGYDGTVAGGAYRKCC